MEYGMVSILIPEEYEETFRMNSKNTMQDAANALQWNLYRGLCDNLGREIPLFNLLPCGSYPQYCKEPFIPRFSFDVQGQNLAFCNIKLIRNFFKTVALEKALKKWCRSDREPKTLFVYTISQSLLAAVSKIKRMYPEIHVCAIVADLPNLANLSSKQSLLLKLFSAHRAKASYSLLSSVDAFVLLTKHMADYMHIEKPYCVMEGIASVQGELSGMGVEVTTEKYILYSGTLHKKFGILHLLEAFRFIPEDNVSLLICGIGDSESDVRKAEQKDPRIRFLGQQPHGEVLNLQKKATVLVNPRMNNEEFTKYSFPSKNLEYLASGVPLVAYKLDGIPDEYDPYIKYPSDDTPEALAHALRMVFEMRESERRAFGQLAKSFVTKNKNKVIQSARILQLVNDIDLRLAAGDINE